jgi:shikimate 5-dehydrogenase
MLNHMHLVALVDGDPNLTHALRSFRDGPGRFHIHPVPAGSMTQLLRSLARLDFAGALVLGQQAQADAQAAADRSSLDAQELGAADTLTVTPAGVMADHTFGRAVAGMLSERRWDAAGANAVILGANAEARALARELARLGVASLTLLAADRVAAERALPSAMGPSVMARSSNDPLSTPLLERADLLIRVDPAQAVEDAVLGPHLAVIDLAQHAAFDLRRRAIELGALTFARREVEAHRFQLSLSQVLGGSVGVESFRQLFQAF